MRGISGWAISLFANPVGVVLLAALDSTLFFSLPFGIDAVVVIVAARLRETWWLVPLLATFGSVAGAALTFWMGVKVGEKGLDRWVPDEKRLEAIRRRIREKGAVALAVLDLIPPPFPFTPFVLAAGALEVDPRTFFGTLAVCRIFRFGVEAALAIRYGRSILSWLDSEIFQDVVTFFIVVAAILTTLSIVKIVRSGRAPRRSRAAA